MATKRKQRRQQRSQLPLFLILAGVVLIVGVLIYAAVSGRGTSGGNTAGSVPYADIQRVSLADAKSAYDQKSALFLDVRDASSYKASHIPGAVNIPLGELGNRLGELDKNQWIITYCTWPAEESSARAAQTLFDNGFTNVHPILGGFAAWNNAGYPVER